MSRNNYQLELKNRRVWVIVRAILSKLVIKEHSQGTVVIVVQWEWPQNGNHRANNSGRLCEQQGEYLCSQAVIIQEGDTPMGINHQEAMEWVQATEDTNNNQFNSNRWCMMIEHLALTVGGSSMIQRLRDTYLIVKQSHQRSVREWGHLIANLEQAVAHLDDDKD